MRREQEFAFQWQNWRDSAANDDSNGNDIEVFWWVSG